MAASNSTDFAKETVQVLKDQWKCGICENGPRPGKVSWYKCNAGHSVCQDCYKETCQTEITKTIRKKGKDKLKKIICNAIVSWKPCKLTEALLSMKSMQFMCVNAKYGCNEILDKEAMIYHEPECIYRKIILSCCKDDHVITPSLQTFNSVICRMKMWHCRSFEETSKISLNEKGTTVKFIYFSNFYEDFWYNPRIFEVDGRTFISSLRQIRNYKNYPQKEAHFYHWIHLVGSEYEAKNYVYTLEYIGKDGRFATFDGQVIPIDKHYKSFINEHRPYNCDSSIGFQIDFGIVKQQFIIERKKSGYITNSFKYTLEIRKEEFKEEKIESGTSDDDSSDEDEVVDEEEEQLCQELSPIDEPNDDEPVVEI